MRIGIDISTVLNHGKDVGAGRYIINLVKNLFEIDSDDEFILTGRYITDEYLWLVEELRQHYIRVNDSAHKPPPGYSILIADNNGVEKSLKDSDEMGSHAIINAGEMGDKVRVSKEYRSCTADITAETDRPDRYLKNTKVCRSTSWTGHNKSGKLSFKLIKTTQKKLDLSNRLGFPLMEFYGFKADVFHCPDFLIPPTLNNKIVLTIHDLAFIRFPQFNFDWFVKKYTNLVRRNAGTAAGIIADSQSTKNDIVDFFGIKEEKVTVVHLAGDEVFRKLEVSEIDNGIAAKYKITKKFVLSAGTIEPRKNYVTLIKAFNMLKSSGDLQLVIVGRTGWMSEATIDAYNSSPFKDDIILAGRLSDAELLQMYNMAELFVYPSVFEGFGLPVVEAMQCGLPVIASDSSSIPELIVDKSLLFNPADEGDILYKMNFVLNDDTLKAELSEKALQNATKFSWKNTAQKTLEVYRKVYKS